MKAPLWQGLAAAALLAGCASDSGIDRKAAAQANVDLASAYLRQDDLGRAQRFYGKALGYNDDSVAAAWGMAITQQRIGHADKARRYYRQALDIERRPAIVNSFAAFVCQQGDVDRATKLFQQAAGDSGYNTSGVALANAGLCLQRAGQSQAAERFYQRALGANASQPLALAQLAKMKYQAGDYLRARAFIQRADAARALDLDQLKLAAQIELAANNPALAQTYVKRYNNNTRGGPISIGQLRQEPRQKP